MKKLIIILAVFFTLQSCNVYKATNSNELKAGKTYKMTYNDKELKAKFMSEDDSNVVFATKKDTMNLKKDDIKNLKIRKFSTIKTIGFGILVVCGIAVADFVIDPGTGKGTTMQSPN
ncbi:hypothetical protein ACFSX9_14450 [Flavobacterium ardleyense]|uniref:Lipoprotein n=1 Tax=Flavobacterium ardleyense TaxID=2038737 RepID=A0ABW5ZAL3_9FLAO